MGRCRLKAVLAFYNPKHKHPPLGYQSPVQFEERLFKLDA